MLEGLQKRWKVSGKQLILILIVFAITGSATAWISAGITSWVHIKDPINKYLVKIAVLLLGYPFILILVSIPFGQFDFFTSFLKKTGKRMGLIKDKLPSIAIFASGAGSNARRIIEYSQKKKSYKVAVIVSNKNNAGVLAIANEHRVPTIVLDKQKFCNGNAYSDELKRMGVELIVLAGFLWKVPTMLLEAFPESIINIHPALLPSYGGKGMYGKHVHESVLAANEKTTGITVHYVDGHYDNGDTIFQALCSISEDETPDTLAHKVHQLEYLHYPRIVEEVLEKKRKRAEAVADKLHNY